MTSDVPAMMGEVTAHMRLLKGPIGRFQRKTPAGRTRLHEIAREDVDVVAVGDGRGRRRLVQDVRVFMSQRLFGPLPDKAPLSRSKHCV